MEAIHLQNSHHMFQQCRLEKPHEMLEVFLRAARSLVAWHSLRDEARHVLSHPFKNASWTSHFWQNSCNMELLLLNGNQVVSPDGTAIQLIASASEASARFFTETILSMIIETGGDHSMDA